MRVAIIGAGLQARRRAPVIRDWPGAEIKIFLTAKPEVRAFRRYNELLQKFPEEAATLTYDRVLESRSPNLTFKGVSPFRNWRLHRYPDNPMPSPAQLITPAKPGIVLTGLKIGIYESNRIGTRINTLRLSPATQSILSSPISITTKPTMSTKRIKRPGYFYHVFQS